MLNLLNLWQKSPLLKLGVLGISLLCYAALFLHPLLAHTNLFSIPVRSGIVLTQSLSHPNSSIQSIYQISSEQVNSSGCPICHQSAGNPAMSFSASVPLFQRPLAYLIKPFTVFLLSSQALANQDSRGPPAATV